MTYIKIANYLPSSESTRECENEKRKYGKYAELTEQDLIKQEQAQIDLEQVLILKKQSELN